MKLPRKHALAISLALGASLAAGGYALTQTAGVASSGVAPAAASSGVSERAVAAKNAQLDALERSLNGRMERAEAPVAQPSPRTVRRYVRPPARVITVSRHHDDDDAYEREGADD